MGSGLNLIPASLLAHRRRVRGVRRGLRLTAGYLALLLLATLAYLGTHAPRGADAAAKLAVGQQQIDLLQSNIQNQHDQLIELERRINGARVISEQPDWSALLRLIAQAAGDQVLLNQFRIAPAPDDSEAAIQTVIGGLAADPWTVSAFALRLEDHQLFDRVRIESSRREPFRDRTATAFTLHCTIATPSPPLPATPPAGADR